MKKYLISLEKDQPRRELFFQQADTHDFTIFSAINTMGCDLDELDQQFHLTQFKTRYARDVTKGEVGCTLSHLAVYQQIVADETIHDDDYTLICEDDALFATNFQQNLTALLPHLSADMVLLGQSKVLDFNHTDLEYLYPTTCSLLCSKIDGTEYKSVYPYRHYYAGTVAYLIKKSAAKILLNHITKQGKAYWLADDFILFGQELKLDIRYIRPLMVIENPTLNSNLAQARLAQHQSSWKMYLKYPLKKLFAIKNNWGK
ncbi:Lsg locus protein 4 [Pasteurellaceae bacterium Macca]|nr:Lsg locus protein 4 [Pasteurellaceae bacterium Macca]